MLQVSFFATFPYPAHFAGALKAPSDLTQRKSRRRTPPPQSAVHLLQRPCTVAYVKHLKVLQALDISDGPQLTPLN